MFRPSRSEQASLLARLGDSLNLRDPLAVARTRWLSYLLVAKSSPERAAALCQGPLCLPELVGHSPGRPGRQAGWMSATEWPAGGIADLSRVVFGVRVGFVGLFDNGGVIGGPFTP